MGKFIDLTNKQFGRLLVVDKNETFIYSGNKYRIHWNCKCSCGNVKIVSGENLSRGTTKSCGCLRKERAASTKVDLINKVFTNLTVIKDTNKRADSNVIWLCKCSCGNFTEVPGSCLTKNHTTSCGCIQKQKAAFTFIQYNRAYRVSLGYPPDHIISSTNKLDRSKLTLSGLKQVIITRDNYCCVLCNSTNKLKVHHIEPFSKNIEKRHDENNLITLCELCHGKAHNNRKWRTVDLVIQKQLQEIINT